MGGNRFFVLPSLEAVGDDFGIVNERVRMVARKKLAIGLIMAVEECFLEVRDFSVGCFASDFSAGEADEGGGTCFEEFEEVRANFFIILAEMVESTVKFEVMEEGIRGEVAGDLGFEELGEMHGGEIFG